MPRVKLGILTPSSNTSLEPLTQALVASLPGVSVHFSRFPVVKISLDSDGLAQFDNAPILAAARLLADAEVDMIGWSGTSAGWLGFAADDALCAAITEATHIPATTSVIALNTALRVLGVRRMGLVTPYTDDVQAAIVRNYATTLGVDCSGPREAHLGLSRNAAFADVDEPTLDSMVDRVVAAGKAAASGAEDDDDDDDEALQAVSTFCTNLYAAQRVAHWEKTHGIPVLDTTATVVWGMLRQLGVDTTPLAADWGMMFAKDVK